jgi:hypothetical protein
MSLPLAKMKIATHHWLNGACLSGDNPRWRAAGKMLAGEYLGGTAAGRLCVDFLSGRVSGG